MSSTANSCHGDPARILIVDDHPNTASMLARALERFDNNLSVTTAHSGEEAFELIQENIVDVLITDFLLPGISGLELIRKFRREASTGPEYIILITAYGSSKLTEAVRCLQINDYLVKPVSPEKIVSIVCKAIEGMQTPSPSPPEKIATRQYKILVADDNQDNVRLLTKRLSQDGYQFITAANGEDVLTRLRAEPIDLVLLDVNMPKKDGFEVLAEMRADLQLQHTPVIMITAARIDARDIRTGLTLGADDYLTKPLDWRELIARVRTKLRVKQFEDTLRRRNYQLSLLPEIGQDLSARTDVDEIADLLMDRTALALDAAAAYLASTSQNGEISHKLHLSRDFTPHIWNEIKAQLKAADFFSDVIDERVGFVVNDALDDSRWPGGFNKVIRSAIAVPLLGQREVIGVLTLIHEQPGHFNEESLTFLRAIASQAAIAIEDAQLYTIERKRANELVALNKLTQELSLVTHSGDLFEKFLRSIHESLGYRLVVIWEVVGDEHRLTFQAGDEIDLSGLDLAFVTEQVIKENKAVILFEDSTQVDDSSMLDNAQIQGSISAVAVPIFADGDLSHVLAVYSEDHKAFQESDRVVLEMLAAQMSATLERIRLFESVEQEQHRLAAVLHAAADAILVLDRDGNLQMLNPAAHQLFTDVDTKIGRPLPVDRGYDNLIELLAKARESGRAEKVEIAWPDERTFAVLLTPIEEGGQVAVLHDVSYFIDLERVKNEFIATVSHDLKSPIGAVLGFSDLMEKAGPLNDDQKDFVNRIKNASTQMHGLVLNMLELIRIDLGVELRSELFDVQDLLISVTHDLQVQAQARDQKISLTLPEGRPQALGVVSRLRQVMYNLIGNAIKYSSAGGQITVQSEQQDSCVWIKVCDTGFGIPPEDLPFIFDKFCRVYMEETKDIEGNGLGLAIVKAIVEQHGGEVTVESILGKGSCFSFSLPMAPIQNKIAHLV